MPRSLIILLTALVVAQPAMAQSLREVLERTPPDSLVAPLRLLEARSVGAGEAGEAAYTLGQLHYARGEYRQAADAYGRAAARLEPARKGEARYWAGLAWLGAGDPTQARAALEEVARSDPRRRGFARLGVALAWEAAQRPDKALDELDRLIGDGAGEAGPAALAHLEGIAQRLNRDDIVRRASERLLREWPASLEAARERSALLAPSPAASTSGVTSVQIGAFADPARARTLAESAKRAGFTAAQVVERRDGASVTHLVRLGDFPDAAAAKLAGEKASKLLGVSYEMVKP